MHTGSLENKMRQKILTGLMILGGILLLWLLYFINQIRIDINSVVDYNPPLTTQVYDRNNQLVANIFEKEHRLYAPYKMIPGQIIESLIAIEDTDFFEHGGINVEAINRAIIKDIQHFKLVEGASTLTQQLIKTMLLTREKKITRKLKEIVLALQIESLLTKEEILERYLNQVYFGHGYYGIRTAALGYFKKELHELNLKEIAILVGLPKAPSFYDPTKNIKFSLSRGNQVITRLRTLGWINEKQYNDAMNYEPIVYNESLTQNKAPYAIEAAIKELQQKYPDIKTRGYTIKLSLDLNAQKFADESLRFGYENIKGRDQKIDTDKSTSKTLNGAIIVLDNQTGGILAMSGGVDYFKSPYNRATQGLRQSGSAIKPFVYLTALEQGYSSQSQIDDTKQTFEYKTDTNETKKWQPKNYGNEFKGVMSLESALVHSSNLATINLTTKIGLRPIYKNLIKYGLQDIPYNLSITLGSLSVTPLKMSELYTIFSNNGTKLTPYLVESIFLGNNILEKREPKGELMADPEKIRQMTSMLRKVVGQGTGTGAATSGLEIAGKTGTTNNNMDAWFCGYSPTTQVVVWFGNDDNRPMRVSETGGRGAAPVAGEFFKKWINHNPNMKRYFGSPPASPDTNTTEEVTIPIPAV